MMDSTKPEFILRSTSAVSLNERFSQVLVDQLTQSRRVTFDPVQLQQRRVSAPPPVVLLVKRELPSLFALQAPDSVQVKQRLTRRSVWTRLGWRHVTRRRGFWSFMNKYRRSAGFSSAHQRRGNLRSRLGQRCLPKRRNIQKPTAGRPLHLNLRGGGATALRGRGLIREKVPTRKQLDAQLDEYMSMSRNRLDKQLDDYMSMSRSRLDAELDDYMSMAGQTPLHWD